MNEEIEQVLQAVNQQILGKEAVVREIMLTVLAEGHVLLVDIPGVGKTTLVKAFAQVLGLSSKRVSFSNDTMPADLTGFSIYSPKDQEFHYREGALFANIFLADEINRTSPKTQAALLEAMEEGSVSVEGTSRQLPKPFVVLATENPLGSIGTQPLPEAEVDRFMVSLSIGYPDFESELRLVENAPAASLPQVMDAAGVEAAISAVKKVYVASELAEYAIKLVRASRESSLVKLGVSPRASVALIRLAKASAYLDGRDFVTPADIQEQYPYVMRHRLILSEQAAGMDASEAAAALLKSVKAPGLGFRR
ncbi:ATPase [Lactobacillus nasalidis]|uniref:ATPase n=1 Tax=Lactobacillus nasalidis TaxID=2797258 RepID=A0ABQ3W4Z6_9LACO|nr:MoxR family ATPase [Lactobacillus nasalidis]GHV98174.1 ATPase [Lactobacillus nasalidis]GHV99978.1 ATPase [Lactobacillus nasalidis]GHW00405.1 ATPase [Lactobacillus nasalidis]